MNLLKDEWIPVRPLPGGKPVKVSLKELLCGEGRWEVCLPRDDMELAAIQLLVCITQVIFLPKTAADLKQRIARPLTEQEYDNAIIPYDDWFQLDHPNYPFMQMRGAKSLTSMDKLMTGLDSQQNCCFVNEPGLASQLCGGCTSIALFNLGSCSPSFGGGFKPGLRGPATPITTLIQGRHLRETIWLNVIYEDDLTRIIPWHVDTKHQKPTWMELIQANEKIPAQKIGLFRGLFWQPAYVEMLLAAGSGLCSCCGFHSDALYSNFNKDKFFFEITGKWPHLHSPMITIQKNGELKEEHLSFKTSSAPSWTQLARFVVKQSMDATNTEGRQPAAVVLQASQLYGSHAQKLHLLIGGYLNRGGQASVHGRRHDVYTLNNGWDRHGDVIKQLVSIGLGYKDALSKSLSRFAIGLKESKGNKKIKGLGEKIKISEVAASRFYRRAESAIQDTLARIDFDAPLPVLTAMRTTLKQLAIDLFNESVRPYLNDPELIKTMAVARRTLNKHLRNLEPQQDEGGNDGTAAA